MRISPESILDRLDAGSRRAHGIPEPADVERRERGAALVRQVLADRLRPDGLRVSPLGPGWSSDIDAHVTSWPPDDLLLSAGWLPLDRTLNRLGSRGRGRWAVVDGLDVLVGVDLHMSAPPDPVAGVLARCRRRREVRLREALELSTLVSEGHTLPASGIAIREAAAIEASWGGDVLGGFLEGDPRPGPVVLSSSKLRGAAKTLRRPFRRRLTVALSGVDGAGKTTAGRTVRAALERVGVPVAAVWARPGLNLGLVNQFSRVIKRMLGQSSRPGMAIAAEGQGDTLPSRRGLIGWTWSLIVTISFLADVYRQHLKCRGIVFYDRHVVDAVATLNVLYGGPDLRLQRALVRWFMPRPEFTAYLDIDADVAASRKPGDMIGQRAVAAQLEFYAAELPRVKRLLVLDGTASVDENALAIVRRLLAG